MNYKGEIRAYAAKKLGKECPTDKEVLKFVEDTVCLEGLERLKKMRTFINGRMVSMVIDRGVREMSSGSGDLKDVMDDLAMFMELNSMLDSLQGVLGTIEADVKLAIEDERKKP